MKESLALDAQLITECGVAPASQRLIISPFVSGTFHGFEEEFKHIHTEIFPEIDRLCKEKGLRFFPVDKRRTAIETRSSADYMLTHALNAIKECSPFFMAIFGEQYGQHRCPTDPPLSAKADNSRQTWSSLSTLDRNLLTAGKHGHWWVMENKWQYCSMFELEIQAAALRENQEMKNCFFYVRDFKSLYLKAEDYSLGNKTEEKENWRSATILAADGVFEAENEHAKKRVNDLKMQIVRKGWSIRYFTSPSELGAAMLQDWIKVINHLYPTPWIQNELTDAWRYNKTSRRYHEKKYYSNKDLKNLACVVQQHTNQNASQEDVSQRAESVDEGPLYGFGLFHDSKQLIKPQTTGQNQNSNSNGNILVLVGDPGSGKSSLLATWLRQYESSHPESLVISEFLGSSYFSRDIGAFLRRCIKIIREIGGKSTTFSELLEDTKDYSSLISAFHVSISQVPVVLVIDSLNDMKESMGEDIGSIKRLTWLPSPIPSNCKIIFSTRRSDLTYKSLTSRSDVIVKWMPILPKVDRIHLLKSRLDYNLLSLGTANSEKLTGNRLSEKPLFLVTVANLISSCTSQREVDKVLEKCTELRTFRDFWKTTFGLWSLRYSWRKGSQGKPGSCRSMSSGWVVDSLRLLAVSRNGLLESEILHILFLLGYRGKSLVTPYDWIIFQNAAKDAFMVQPDGCIVLSHTEIRHAAKFFLLGMPLPSATASAATLGGVNMRQHFHSVLSSYFLSYGTIDRKLIELPWQLEQGGDLVLLCQVLSKPRFFKAFCQEASNNPHISIDLFHFWKKLNEAGFNPTHYLQTMVERASGRTKGIFFLDSQYDTQTWRPSKLGMSSLKTMSTVSVSSSSMKRPSLTVSMMQDEYRRQSTIGSRSEAGDFELMSEAESYSFFVTENESKSDSKGWSAKETNPENLIDESYMDDDESCQLSYEVCMFFEKLGGNFVQDCKDGLLALSQLMLEMRPLSSSQQVIQVKTLCSLAKLSGEDQNSNFVQCLCEEALEILDSLCLNVCKPLTPFHKSVLEAKVLPCRLLAEVCLSNHDFQRAEYLLKQASFCLKSFHNKTEESNLKFSFARLYIAKSFYDRAETNLKEVLTERLRWYGHLHLSVACVLQEIGDLYMVLESQKLSKQRVSLLAYRQAFKIFRQHSDKSKEAALLHKIGAILRKEGSLFSTQEAGQCLENAMDLYVTHVSPAHSDIPMIREHVKKISVNLLQGCYEFGHGKPVDKRTDEFAFSSLTWHDHHLREISSRKSIRSAPSAISELRLHSARQGRIQITSAQPSSLLGDVQSGIAVKSGRASTVRYDITSIPEGASQSGEFKESEPEEKKSTVILPTGRESQLSVKLRVTEESEKSVSIRMPNFKGVHGLKLPEDLSEIMSEYSGTTYTKVSQRQVRDSIHKKHCRPASGPNGLCLTVHGAHSTVESILDPPPSPRINVRGSAVLHKSAWFSVPGRYKVPGKVLPPKYCQVRHERPPLSSRRSCRSVNTV